VHQTLVVLGNELAVERLAREREVGLAQCFVLGRVGMDQLGHVFRVGFPVHDQLGFTDLLTHAGADHVNAHDGAVLLANEFDDAAGTQDGALAVAGKVVFLGLTWSSPNFSLAAFSV
jgi:hypothetical protein